MKIFTYLFSHFFFIFSRKYKLSHCKKQAKHATGLRNKDIT